MSTKSAFEQLVEASGLSPIFGPAALTRALMRVGVKDVRQATIDDLRKALPEIERAVGVFLAREEVPDAMRRIRATLDT